MQPEFFAVIRATARACTVWLLPKMPAKNVGSTCETITSTALLLAVFGPDSGGQFTVTVAFATPLVKPFKVASFRAAPKTSFEAGKLISAAPAMALLSAAD